MLGGEASNPKPIHKVYRITNIKTYMPLILDLTTHNYEPWSDLFKAHCIAYDVLDHIDGEIMAVWLIVSNPHYLCILLSYYGS